MSNKYNTYYCADNECTYKFFFLYKAYHNYLSIALPSLWHGHTGVNIGKKTPRIIRDVHLKSIES